MRRFQYNTRPLVDEEMDSIRYKDDIITLRSGRALASFDSMVERSIESMVMRIDRTLQVSGLIKTRRKFGLRSHILENFPHECAAVSGMSEFS